MKKEIVWHVEKRKVADLKPHPDNARIFTEKGMQDLKRSISNMLAALSQSKMPAMFAFILIKTSCCSFAVNSLLGI